MKKVNILVFPAGTEIAMEILNSLKYEKYINLFGGSSVLCHGEFVFNNYIDNFPFINESNFIEYINSVIDKYNIDFVYPAYDDVCLYLTKQQKLINAKIITSPLETVEICRSKNKTYECLKNEYYIPKFYTNTQSIDNFPVFVKPSIGQGSQGAVLIKDKEELGQVISQGKELTICEYLPGEEYTIDCFTDKDRVLRSVVFRNRERIKSGIAVRSRILQLDKKVEEIANNINEHFEFNGAWFFQLKKDINNNYKLLEISPRIPGTSGASRNLGINYPMLTIYNMLGYNVDIVKNDNNLLLDRAFISRFKTDISYSTVYIDFDDCIYINDKVNTTIMAFLYQCVNNNIKIHLITKHSKNLDTSLSSFRISKSLFDEIIQIDNHHEKSDYIVEKDSIFIDDSFSERRKVKEKCNIPVFGLDMVESLLDWKR